MAEEEEEAAGRPSESAVPPAVDDGEAAPQGDDEEDEDGWGGLFEGLAGGGDEPDHPGSSGIPSEPDGLRAVSAGSEPAGTSDDRVRRLCSVDVSEVSSPPRVGKEAMKFDLGVGDAMDLTTGSGFTKEEDRVKAEK